MPHKAAPLKIKKSNLFFTFVVLLGSIFSTPTLAMVAEERKTEEAREDSNAIVLPIDVWVRVSAQLTSKRDVVNFSRVCKFAHDAIRTDAAWEGVAKIYGVRSSQVKDPSFFIKRKADKAARIAIVRREQHIPQYSHLGEILPRKGTRGISRKPGLSRTHHKSDGLYD